jgi:hypothetical protein
MEGVQMIEAFRRLRRHRVLGHVLRFRPLALALALVLVVATATATAEAPTGSVIYGRLGTEDARLSIPATDEPKGVAVFFHGQNGHVDNRMDEPWLQSLVRDGWIVASSDFHTDSWGNEASTDDTRRLVAWAEQETGQPVRLFISGSMGGTVSLNAIVHGVAAPPCWYGVKSAVDVTTMDEVPGANRIISEAYAGEPVPADRNPVNRIGALPVSTRYRMVASPADQWVPFEANTRRLSEGLERRGAEVSVLTVEGGHDDPSHFNVADLVEFAATCAQ